MWNNAIILPVSKSRHGISSTVKPLDRKIIQSEVFSETTTLESIENTLEFIVYISCDVK
jgi:hypothetical protein